MLSNRTQRLARVVPEAEKVIAILKRHRRHLVAAAEAGQPPASAVSEALVGALQSKTLKARIFKQFVGLAVRDVLDAEGFEVAGSGVRLRRDPLFSFGSVYRRRPTVVLDPTVLAIINSLPTEQLLAVKRYLNEHEQLKELD